MINASSGNLHILMYDYYVRGESYIMGNYVLTADDIAENCETRLFSYQAS